MARATTQLSTTRTTVATSTRQSTGRKSRVRLGPTVLQTVAALWATMDDDERNSFARVRGEMANAAEPALKGRRTAYATFVILAAANLAAGRKLERQARPYRPAPPLPHMDAEAVWDGQRLTVTLTPDAPYPHAVAVKSCRPMLALDSPTTATPFKKIGHITELSGPVDITDLWYSRYRVYGTGSKIVLELMGVAPGGFQTTPVTITAVVTRLQEPAASGGRSDDMATEVDLMLTTLTDPDPEARADACEALGEEPDIRAVPALLHTLETDPADDVRVAAALALGEAGDKDAVPALLDSLTDAAWTVRGACVLALGQIDPHTASPHVLPLLQDTQAEVRGAAAWMLGKARDPSRRPLLEPLLTDASDHVRDAAAEALHKLRAG